MAAGNRLLPGPPAVQPMTTDQATAAVQEPIGPETDAQPPQGAWAKGPAKIAGSLPAGVGLAAARKPARGWGGAGGRWLLWVFRAVLWTALLVIGYRGVAAIVTGQPVTGRAPGAAAAQPGQRAFPVSLARAYAMAFGQVYLNYNAATAARRSATLATFLPPGADPQIGWNGTGAQTLQFEQVAGVTVDDPHRAVVTLLARVSGHLIEVGVPIYATSAGMVVSGRPALLPPPSSVAPPSPAVVPQDGAARLALKRMLPGFFRAYASGDAIRLAAYSPQGTVITGLGRVAAFAGLVKLIVPAAAGQVRHIVVTVSWRQASSAVTPAGGQASPARGKGNPAGRTAPPSAHAPASVQMTYALTVLRQRGTWLVRSIGPAASQPWPSS